MSGPEALWDLRSQCLLQSSYLCWVSFKMHSLMFVGGSWSSHCDFLSTQLKSMEKIRGCFSLWELRMLFCMFMCSTVSGNWLTLWTSWKDSSVVDSTAKASVRKRKRWDLCKEPTSIVGMCVNITVLRNSAHNVLSHFNLLFSVPQMHELCLDEDTRISLGNHSVNSSLSPPTRRNLYKNQVDDLPKSNIFLSLSPSHLEIHNSKQSQKISN
jgi:hypothetical protein